MQELTMDEFLMMFVSEIHEDIRKLGAKDGVTHLVLFENQMFDSSEFGRRTAVSIGSGCTYQGLSDVKGHWLFDLPSQRQYPTAYVKTKGD